MATVLGTEMRPGDSAGEMVRLREENRKLAVALGAFSAFIAARGMLEEAWRFINEVHQMDDEEVA